MSNVLRFSMVLVLLAMGTKRVNAQSKLPCFLQVQDEEGIDLPGATVWLDGKPVGTTNARGQWPWNPQMASEVDHVLEVTSIGFDPVQVIRQCAYGETWSVVLTPNTVALGGATVVGGLKSMTTKESPIQTQVISGAALQLVHAQDVVESLDFTNGVRETVGCGICGTNDIHMNGMEGAYTLVLIDGVRCSGAWRPPMRSMAFR
jgi:outer membrane receptor for ferrienterochelin and colicins